MSETKHPGLVSSFLKTFFGSIGLLFIPMPISWMRRQLAGRHTYGGEMEFYSHPDFICTMHLIWVGWLVTLGALYNEFARENDWSRISDQVLYWPWLFVLLLTLVVLGLQFGRVALGFLIATIVIVGLALALTQTMAQLPLFKDMYNAVAKVPVEIRWGVPFVVSLVLGILFVCVASWRRLNDRWTLKPVGNYLEHENFQEKDRTISKGAKTFVAVFPCLIRRYLFFGYGDIEVRSSTGTTLVDRIEGVLFARHHAEIIKSQFSTTDIKSASYSDAEEEEEVADEDL